MSDPQQTVPAAGGSLLSSLTGLQTILVVVGSLTGTAVLIAGNLCKLPYVSAICPAPAAQTEPTTAPTPTPSRADANAQADFAKRVAALGVAPDPTLESVILKIYHQQGQSDPLVDGVLVGLRAAGFNVGPNVNEVQVSLANVADVDRTPGMVWIKSVAALKARRASVRAAILKALPGIPFDRVKASDDDLPADDAARIKRAGEIQVDVF